MDAKLKLDGPLEAFSLPDFPFPQWDLI